MVVTRVPVVDEVVEDGESVVLLPSGRVVVLSALATALLAELGAGPLPVEALAERLVAAFGSPPDDHDGVRTTEAAVVALGEEGLVEVAVG